jgi:hypothetical protein
MGMQLTRGAHALKVWLSVRYFGLQAFRDAIGRGMELARQAERRISASPVLELMSPASLGIVCFRRTIPGADEATVERVNRTIARELEIGRNAFVSSTRLHGRYALRICVLNHTSTADDVNGVLDWFEQADVTSPEQPEQPTYDRQPDIRAGWPGGLASSIEQLSRFGLFRQVDPRRLEAVAVNATPRTIPAGQAVVQQWESGDDFFLIDRGTVEVLVNGERVRTLAGGDYFGELAALDWGASFHYPRLASVVASEETVVLALPPSTLAELMRDNEDVAAQIRQTVSERLAKS